MKLLLIILLLLPLTTQAQSQSQKATPPKPAAKAKPAKTSPKKTLQENQYSLDKDNKITIFKTTLYDNLLLSEDCFPGQSLGNQTTPKTTLKKPTCMAYTKSLNKTTKKPEDNFETPFHNNLGSIHCKLMGGTGLIAKSHENGESDFCQFNDGSMVSSWSAYYKTNPSNESAKDKKTK